MLSNTVGWGPPSSGSPHPASPRFALPGEKSPMFAYVVKRLLAGVVVLALVSMAIFLLFWYGPSSPAQPICDRETSNRCTPARLERYEQSLGYDNPVYEEYGKFVKGVFVGRDDHDLPHRLRLPRALPGLLLPDQGPGVGGDEGAPARHPLGRHRRRRSSTCSSACPSASPRPEDGARSPTRRWCRASWCSARSPTTCSRC